MATKTTSVNTETAADSGAAPDTAAAAPKPADLVSEIGTLTYPRAVARFGKERALAVMKRVAAIGGHGDFDDAELTSPLFGGLQMPNPDLIIKPKEEDFAHLPEAAFYFQAAQETYEENQKRAAANLGTINEYYNSLV